LADRGCVEDQPQRLDRETSFHNEFWPSFNSGLLRLVFDTAAPLVRYWLLAIGHNILKS